MTKVEWIMNISEQEKVHMTMAELLKNSKKVLGRDLTTERKVKILKTTATPGMSTFRVDAEAYGEKSLYNLSILFNKVSFVEKKDSKHPLPVKLKGGETFYMEKLNARMHPVKVWCSCRYFQFYSEWYLHKAGSLIPVRKPRPYTKKPGSKRPSVNPEGLPNICKHLYALAMEMGARGMMINVP